MRAPQGFGVPPWAKIRGKPYITVSAKGIVNGLSDIPNDGADFGPDTMLNATAPYQYGPPYTQTSGIQEAINYIASSGGVVHLKAGNYYVNADIQLLSNLTLEGESGATVLNMNKYSFKQSTALNYVTLKNFVVNNGGATLGSPNIFVYPPQSNHLVIENVKVYNNIQGSSPFGYWVINGWYDVVMKDVLIVDSGKPTSGMDGVGLGANVKLRWSGGGIIAPSISGAAINWQGTIQSTGTEPLMIDPDSPENPTGTEGMTNTDYVLENLVIVGDWAAFSIYPNFWGIRVKNSVIHQTGNSGSLFGTVALQYPGGSGTMYGGIEISDSTIFNSNNPAAIFATGGGSDATVHYSIKLNNIKAYFLTNSNSEGQFIGLSNTQMPTIVQGNNITLYGTTTANLNAPTLLSAMNTSAAYDATFTNVHIIARNGYLYYAGGGGSGILLPSPTGQFERCIVENLTVESEVAPTGGSWVIFYIYGNGSKDLPGSVFRVNGRWMLPLDSVAYGAGTNFALNGTPQYPHLDPSEFSLSTPSVPASGTAQQNTNPFAVEIALYGGTVTAITITRGGTTYTVFSNSSGAALSGQTYRLEPGDSITLTYSSAPSWTWLPA